MHKKLKLWDAVMLVMGSMIGSGIFIVSADIMRNLGSGLWLIIVWVITGIMTIAAAISYGELSALFPKAGGQYTYLKEIFGKKMGFLYGWGLFTVIQTGTIAAVAVAFGKYTAYLIPALNDAAPLFQSGEFKITWIQIVAILVIMVLTYINTRGVESGKLLQNVFTGSKILALLGLIAAGFFIVNVSHLSENFSFGWDAFNNMRKDALGNLTNYGWERIGGMTLLGGIAAAMVGSVFSSVAWESVTFVSGEIENPKKNVVKSMIYGTSAVMVLYIAVNVVYLNALDRDTVAFAANDRVAVAASQNIFGSAGTIIIALLVMISTFGCNNGLILAGARVFQTMAKDGMFFRSAAKNNTNEVPGNALWMQGIWASLLCLSGQYGNLLDMISFVIVLFYMITVFGVIYLRIKQPELPRPYRTWLYPLTPVVYLIIGTGFCILLLIYKQQYTWPGFIMVLLGLPVYYLINRKASSAK
ncbi:MULTISPECIES: APC family permease [Chryseobacterium]|uniref:APA family basic amino acid/polyamine antiporter n=1 Tax=Chryseobacterium camelliae TaxID=1265445 RepID=A0ABU0TGZ0_9FLAO|nr:MULTISPECIES: amino acid permease [Chryseobacterium]MDT3405868.1 APA family basic amino acid/polyamine antiporter [Pseudacidovorax intermedius]MDQ1096327.1 APA family basic amino acid/polyamine antiporter [Chryseobacterium camelliae]MDQ1100266.1 APA family basic amino acid/polyamine antiporter [Chryseobacterium sp. SORGH_AS_1048]MDR6087609.1 APA family basic amino acid/polyamine antiporter [Chryseobacterium sp. SORGH_AS_0909]MDR6131983.1 APA family basic amino acid/polyamine antiporter [Chr